MKRPRGRPKGSKKVLPRVSRSPAPVVSVVEVGAWPDILPVTQQMIRLVETVLAEDLDALLGPLP